MAQHFTEDSVPDQSGKTILITGSNTGIGYEAARVLAGRGARILLGCRSPEKAQVACDDILALHPGADIDIVTLDLANLSSIESAAAQVDKQEKQLDLLINNAGIMMTPHEKTVDGFEAQFGVNHLGHFALTGLLLNKLRETPNARIVTVSSVA
ncbi:MAG: SDR family NAD(P)-dependent oxidoreductase, partial [Pseudomonadota bacterium]